MNTLTQRTGGGAESGGFGQRIMELADRLAHWSESSDGLTCTYLSPAHRTVAAQIRDNAGRYDGRLGVLTALILAEHLGRLGRKLPFHLDVIAFSEEEGVRFSSSFLGSSAVAGRFDAKLLERRDAQGVTLAAAMAEAGLDATKIPALARRRDGLVGYLEVHIEQGPVLLEEGLPVGIVSAITGSVRSMVTITGTAGHAGTVPMARRHDAAAAAAELVLYVEKRCAQAPTLVGTVGKLVVPNGAINIIPGRCELTLDVRSGDDATRDAAMSDILSEMERIAARRGVTIDSQEVQRTAAVQCSARLQKVLADAVVGAGVKPRHLPSGAGHDAMMFSGLTDVAMLFVRCGNGGVSHSPREIITAEDADVAARVMLDAVLRLAETT
ncbi:MAG: hydantoinase/carbamoylase family amidase [Alphaproteobacteria bacterium]|nr:MAG: hydantoinase/carbamoylase family amidase [Alphaproteobacteria bacterium]